MSSDYLAPLLFAVLTGLIALPSIAALQARRRSRDCSAFASRLVEFAAAVRREQRALAIDDSLLEAAAHLRIPERPSFEYLRELAQPEPELLADAAQRLALRLKRRVAFTRKMLARTASGRRRAALAATAPALLLLCLRWTGVVVPLPALVVLIALEAAGCWLVWRLARVGV